MTTPTHPHQHLWQPLYRYFYRYYHCASNYTYTRIRTYAGGRNAVRGGSSGRLVTTLLCWWVPGGKRKKKNVVEFPPHKISETFSINFVPCVPVPSRVPRPSHASVRVVPSRKQRQVKLQAAGHWPRHPQQVTPTIPTTPTTPHSPRYTNHTAPALQRHSHTTSTPFPLLTVLYPLQSAVLLLSLSSFSSIFMVTALCNKRVKQTPSKCRYVTRPICIPDTAKAVYEHWVIN